MQQQISFLDSLCGKTSPEPSVQTEEKTSEPSLKRSAPSAKKTLMFLDLREGMGGNLLGAYWETTTVLPGGYTTPRGGEFHSEGGECTLSEILQLDAPERYSLSPKACAGIIRRAEKRGKELPNMLKDALMEVIGLAGGLDQIEDNPEEDSEDEEYEDEKEYEDEE